MGYCKLIVSVGKEEFDSHSSFPDFYDIIDPNTAATSHKPEAAMAAAVVVASISSNNTPTSTATPIMTEAVTPTVPKLVNSTDLKKSTPVQEYGFFITLNNGAKVTKTRRLPRSKIPCVYQIEVVTEKDTYVSAPYDNYYYAVKEMFPNHPVSNSDSDDNSNSLPEGNEEICKQQVNI